MAQVKFFTPDSNLTWYASEFDGEDIFFGLVSGFDAARLPGVNLLYKRLDNHWISRQRLDDQGTCWMSIFFPIM